MSSTTASPSSADTAACRHEAESACVGSGHSFVLLDGVEMLRITDYDLMPAFLMSVVSDSDLWMFLSSMGGLTAGRVDPDHALFPYETDDKLHRVHPFTGPITLVRVHRGDFGVALWEPFRNHGSRANVTRNLYKSVSGNRVVFEEISHSLGLTFRYQWSSCDALGFVRSASLLNHSHDAAVPVELLDGLLNVIPSGLSLSVTQQLSCLSNAYTRAEADPATGLAVFAMSSLLVDKAEPAEALRANVVWRRGLAGGQVMLDDDAVEAFRSGREWPVANEIKGRRAAYLVYAKLVLPRGEAQTWDLVADVDRSQAQAVALRCRIENESEPQLRDAIRVGLDDADANLVANVAASDGLQHSADRLATAHHFANVLFNNMRGGVFVDGYRLPGEDFAAFVAQRSHRVAQRHADTLSKYTGEIDYRKLLDDAEKSGDADLLRLTYEYLPITFSRRHGDPSRPWNRFAIKLKNPDGSRVLNYEGNWRDIFQNWESMCVSFPRYFESIVAKFVNASTADGFNPYRVTRDGIDWEAPEPGNPWASIGYWGDHQIVYLLKLLEHSASLHPGKLEAMLHQRLFTYADVPYRIAPYEALCRDPHNTITFDDESNRQIEERVKRLGGDGKLLHDAAGELVRVSLAEKLLVPALSKLSNLVVDGGIWMNTQRPEWNDANNALVGHGVSVVTLCYLRRYAAFMVELFGKTQEPTVTLSAEVASWLGGVQQVLTEHVGLLDAEAVSDADRRRVLDALGQVFSDYRQQVYAQGVGKPTSRPTEEVVALFSTALRYLDHAIEVNRRDDGLWHSYNLLELADADGQAVARVSRLQEMLEGQVAVLSTGRLDAEASMKLLDALQASTLYRPDQNSFLLYPDRRLPGFFEKNSVPTDAAESDALLSAMLAAGDTRIVERDAAGGVRFHSDFHKAADLDKALSKLRDDPRYASLVEQQQQKILSIYEQVFNHRAFTGRSGGMYGYEGLGSIYWHMVSKLLLAAQESYFLAAAAGETDERIAALASAYYRVRSGIGFNKTAQEYGAFPTDPYSHTPGHRGAQQPGMTGQVKEEVLTRLGELGVRIAAGKITLRPTLLRRREFLTQATPWRYVDVAGAMQEVALPAEGLGFTYAQVPIVYRLVDGPPRITLTKRGGGVVEIDGDTLDAQASDAVFDRDGSITRIDVAVSRSVVVLD